MLRRFFQVEHHHYHHYPEAEAMLVRLRRLEVLNTETQEILMATKAEVLADLAEMRTEVAETRGAANSAILYIKELLDRVSTAAASATDLDEFRTELAVIKSGTNDTETELKAAIVTNPAPTDPVAPPTP